MEEQVQEYLAYAMLFVTIATPVVDGLDNAAKRFRDEALLTPSPEDDKLADRIYRWTSASVRFLAHATQWLPTLRRGPRK